METYTTTRGNFYPQRQYNRVYEQCLVCERASDDRVHDTEGRQGTGTGAVHPFIGNPEKYLLQFAINEVWGQGKSRPKGGKPTEEMKRWNEAIDKAKAAIARMFAPIDPDVLTAYDNYWNAMDAPEGPLPPAPTRCLCDCCDHTEGADCACDCHAKGACAAPPPRVTDVSSGDLIEALRRQINYWREIGDAVLFTIKNSDVKADLWPDWFEARVRELLDREAPPSDPSADPPKEQE